MKKIGFVLLVGVCMVWGGTASAYQFDFGANSSVTGPAFSGPGLVMQADINPALDSAVATLGVGDSFSVLFATFHTDENWVNGDDTVAQALTANVDFDMPDMTPAVPGTSDGWKSFSGFWQGWDITWSDPIVSTFGPGDTGQFTLALNDISYMSSWWKGPDGCNSYADVYATITLDAEPIPEPATMFLFGTGIACLAGLKRRHNK